ncbi:hypothetical protein BDQ17DRAFT_1426893 [Cyathus striatus]|nr:hypothetical protein BDQ17DRAFT_1426893 [Cyathus striatus]
MEGRELSVHHGSVLGRINANSILLLPPALVIYLKLAFVAAPIVAAPGPLKTIQKLKGETNASSIPTLPLTGSLLMALLVCHYRHSSSLALYNPLTSSDVLSSDSLNTFRTHEDVDYIAEDGIMHTMTTQTDAPWVLQRISRDAKLSSTSTSALTYSYTYDSTARTGVNIYVLDTGIYTSRANPPLLSMSSFLTIA